VCFVEARDIEGLGEKEKEAGFGCPVSFVKLN
jgi:hypothetical protein